MSTPDDVVRTLGVFAAARPYGSSSVILFAAFVASAFVGAGAGAAFRALRGVGFAAGRAVFAFTDAFGALLAFDAFAAVVVGGVAIVGAATSVDATVGGDAGGAADGRSAVGGAFAGAAGAAGIAFVRFATATFRDTSAPGAR